MKKFSILLAVLFISGTIVNVAAMNNYGEFLDLVEQGEKDQQLENHQEKIVNALGIAVPKEDPYKSKCLGIALGCGLACATAAWYIRTNCDKLTWKELYTLLSECFENSYF